MVCVFGWHWQPQGTSPLGFTVSSLYRFLPRLCCFPWNRLELFPSRKWDGISQSSSKGERLKAVNWVNKSFIQLTNIFWVLTVQLCIWLHWTPLICTLSSFAMDSSQCMGCQMKALPGGSFSWFSVLTPSAPGAPWHPQVELLNLKLCHPPSDPQGNQCP